MRIELFLAMGVLSGCGRLGFAPTADRDGGPGDDVPRVFEDATITGGATPIYRSIGGGNTAQLAFGTTVDIVSGQATFDAAVPDKVGVGDVIIAGSTVTFIHARVSNVQYVVRTAAGATPPDASVSTGWVIYRAYTTASNAIAGLENDGIPAGVRDFDSGSRDMVANNEQWNLALYADGPHDTVRLLGWTSDPDHYLRLFAPYRSSHVGTSQRHTGVWDPFKVHFTSEDYFGTINNENEITPLNDVRLEGLQIENFRTTFPAEASGINFDDFDQGPTPRGEVYISGCLIRRVGAPDTGTEHAGIWINGPQLARIVIYNNVILGFRFGIRHTPVAGLTVEIYNNTIVGAADVGIVLDGSTPIDTFRVKNNLVVATGDDYTLTGSATTLDLGYNISEDTTAPGAGSITNGTIGFVDASGGDFRLAPTDTDAIDGGIDLSAGPGFAFDRDIVDAPRGAAWELGAFAY